MLSELERLRYGSGPEVNVKVLIFNEHLRLVHCVKGPSELLPDSEDNQINKPIIFVHDDNFYVKVWTNFEKQIANFRKASLKSITDKSNSPSQYIEWCGSHSIPEMSSNLTLLKNQPVIGIVSTSTADNESESHLYLCALTSCKSGDTLVELASFKHRFDPAPIVVGVSDGNKLVVIGMIKNSSESHEELHVLEAIPQGLC